MSNDNLPPAIVVQDGKLGGDVPRRDPTVPAPAPGPRKPYKRKLSNYLLDKQLQLRYVIVVTLVSAAIAGALGFMIYRQETRASDEITAGMREFAGENEGAQELLEITSQDMRDRDHGLVFKMVGVGLGLTLILSMYLVLMTHKVAGPLYKVSSYFDKMANGRLGVVTPLRQGDMLQDFYSSFREAHEAVRGRQQADLAAVRKLLEACDAAGVERSGELAELATLARHADERALALADR